MNIVKINADIVKALYDRYPNMMAAYREEDESIFITTTGSYGFWLRKDQVLFNLNKVRLLEKPLFNPDDFVSDMQEIVPTDDFKKAGKYFIQKFVSKRPYGGVDWHTWINSSFLRPLARETGVRFYQRFFNGIPSRYQPIMAVQMFKLNKNVDWQWKPPMIFCPMRMMEDDE